MATIDISPSAGTPASTGYLIYTDATTGTFKKAPLSALPLSDAVVTALGTKQATLVSGTNIKTINGSSVLGSGNLTITGTGGAGLGTLVSFNQSIPLDIGNSYMVGNASAGPHTFTPNTGSAQQTGACTLYYKADGSGAPDVSAWVARNGGITNYDDTVDMINELLFYVARGIYQIAVTPLAIETVDSTPPTLTSRTAISRNTIRIIADEPITAASAAGLTASIGGGPITALSISGSSATWDIVFPTNSFSTGDTITLSASGSNTITDTATTPNALVAFTNASVTNNADSTAPLLTSATVENATPTHVDLVFNESMDSTWSAASAFTVSGHTVTAITRLTATTGYLTVSSAFTNGEAARTLAYTQPGSNQMKDLVGNLLATFSGTSITNNVGAADTTAPTLVSATVENATPSQVDLVFDEAMNATWSAAAAFTVTGHTVSSVTRLTGTTGYLTLSTPVTFGETPDLAYTQPVSNKMQDLAGNLLANISAEAITNNVAGPSFAALRFPSRSGVWSESPTGTFNIAASGFGVADDAMAADGLVQFTIPATPSDAEGAYMSLDEDDTYEYIVGAFPKFNMAILSGNLNAITVSGTGIDTGVTVAAGDVCRLYRAGSSVKLAVDTGSGFVDEHAFSDTSSATLYCKAGASGTAVKLVAPSGDGFASPDGLVNLDYTGSTGMTSTGTNKWGSLGTDTAYGHTGKANVKIPAGQYGGVIISFNASEKGVVIGVNTSNAEIGYASMPVGFTQDGATTTIYATDSGTLTAVTTSAASGEKFRMYRNGTTGVITLQKSTDGGATWPTTLHTYTYTSTADLWIVADSYGALLTFVQSPKGDGVTA